MGLDLIELPDRFY
jgi:hypothetical protein